MTQAVDLLIDRSILFNIGIRMGDIGFRLIIIVIRNEILHRVIRKEFPKLRAELGSQRFIMSQHQCGTVQLFNDRSHSKGFTGAGNTQKGLLSQSPVDTVCQRLDGSRLVTGGAVVRF